MSQRCYSCGRETEYGKPLAHFYQCDVAGQPATVTEDRAALVGQMLALAECGGANPIILREWAAALALPQPVASDTKDAERFRRVVTLGKLPTRTTAGYHYDDGVSYPTPQEAIDRAIERESRDE